MAERVNRERELLSRVKVLLECSNMEPLQDQADIIIKEIQELLAQPEQTEPEPVAWITEWVQRYRHNDTPIIDRAVSFTKAGAPAVPDPNYIPLYIAPLNTRINKQMQ